MSIEQAKEAFNKAYDDKNEPIYPKSKDVYKFDKTFSRYALWHQEFLLRKELSDAANGSEILTKTGLNGLLSEGVKNEFISELAYILRYKRLNDIINDAANRTGKGLFDKTVKNNITHSQMDTMIKYSLDTPYLLYHILKKNSFTDKYNIDKDKEENIREQNFHQDDKGIIIGNELKSNKFLRTRRSEGPTVYLNKKGEFVSDLQTYIPLGIGSSGLRRNFFNRKVDGNKFEKELDSNKGVLKDQKLEKTTNIDVDVGTNIQILNAATTTGSVAALGLTWWAFAAVAVGAGVWSGIKYLTDKNGLPEWSVDAYLMNFIPNDEVSKKLNQEATIYFRKQTDKEKESTKVTFALFCQNKSVPNRKSIKDISKEFSSKGGTQKRRSKNNNARTKRLY